MAKVICTRPNASEEISGVKFSPHEDGVISEEISDEQAEHFIAVDGYRLAGAKPAQAPAEQDPELDDLRARATALGITTDARWKAVRLKAEIEKAESTAQAPAEQA